MIDINQLKIRKLVDDARIGTVFESYGSSRIDHFNFFSLYEANILSERCSLVVTGYSIVMPKGYKGLIYPLADTELYTDSELECKTDREIVVLVSNFSTKTINIPKLTHFAKMRIEEVE